MKVPMSLLAVWVSMGVALAQTTPAPQSAPEKGNQKPAKSESKADNQGDTNEAAPAEMKTTNYKGVLVDMACASRMATPEAGHAPSTEPGHPAANGSSDCPVSSSTTEFGLKMEDGKTVRFDLVGNQRAQDSVKNDKSWNKDISANKPIHAKVNGVMTGDKIVVASIH